MWLRIEKTNSSHNHSHSCHDVSGLHHQLFLVNIMYRCCHLNPIIRSILILEICPWTDLGTLTGKNMLRFGSSFGAFPLASEEPYFCWSNLHSSRTTGTKRNLGPLDGHPPLLRLKSVVVLNELNVKFQSYPVTSWASPPVHGALLLVPSLSVTISIISVVHVSC